MGRRTVSTEDKIRINELYLQYGTYAEVARQTGWSAGTVKRYIIPDYTPAAEIVETKVTLDEIGKIDYPFPTHPRDWNICLIPTTEEWNDINELRKELVL